MVLSRRSHRVDLASPTSIQLSPSTALHIQEKQFLEPWRACPMWLGVRWSDAAGRGPRTELLALDSDEAARWVRKRSRSGLEPDYDPELRFESSWKRGDRREYAAVHRVKRFSGF